MVIDKIHIVGLASLEAKNNPPVARDRYGPKVFEFTLEAVKLKARQRHVSNIGRLVQARQNALDLVYLRRRKAAVIVGFVQPSVLKRPDH